MSNRNGATYRPEYNNGHNWLSDDGRNFLFLDSRLRPWKCPFRFRFFYSKFSSSSLLLYSCLYVAPFVDFKMNCIDRAMIYFQESAQHISKRLQLVLHSQQCALHVLHFPRAYLLFSFVFLGGEGTANLVLVLDRNFESTNVCDYIPIYLIAYI